MHRPLLIGEAPGGEPGLAHPPDQALTGASGRNIARLSGLTWQEYLDKTRRVNIFELPQHELWNTAAARRNAAALSSSIEQNTRVILLGVRVAEAFGVSHWPLYEWFQLFPSVLAARLPHPSGKNYALNNAVARASFRKVMREALDDR